MFHIKTSIRESTNFCWVKLHPDVKRLLLILKIISIENKFVFLRLPDEQIKHTKINNV